jgi:gamma-glutamyl hercynylcysteine S-oxide synthase
MPTLEIGTSKLLEAIQLARRESDRLFAILKSQALYERPIAERHRVIFYVGHLDGFDSIQICREALGLPSPDPDLDALFQAGIDPDANHLPSDQPTDWPTLDNVQSYVERCRRHVDENLERASEDVIHMALEHRLMHLETLAYMFHNLPYDLKDVSQSGLSVANSALLRENDLVEIPAGKAVLGKKYDGLFGWDNEYEEIVREVAAFGIQRYSVSNGDYLRFVQQGAPIPHFWVERSGGLFLRGMLAEIPLPLDWPVYVTQREAIAYARWLGKDLPSEEQFHRAAYGGPDGRQRRYPWGNQAPHPQFGNFDFRRWEPECVYDSPAGASAWGVNQLVGNGWQWTSTAFGPLPGFKPRATYPGYSANFFDGDHYVIKGGSPRTAAKLLRSSFRNWFRPDYPYVYATFRCVEN